MTDWLRYAIIAVLLLPPVFISVPVLQRMYGVDPVVTLLWWIVGTAAGIVAWLSVKGQVHTLVSSPQVILIVLVIGLTAGTGSNIALFRAVGAAPNPGLAMAIVNANCVIVYFSVVLLALVLPNYFAAAPPSWQHGAGVLCIAIGIALILIKR